MKLFFSFFIVSSALSILILTSCEEEPNDDNVDIELINYLQSSFNQEELTPDFIDGSESVKIVTFGHVHSLLEFDDLMKSFYAEIEKEKPDYVFILGDIVFFNHETEWNKVQEQINRLGCQVFYAPGNHDINYYSEREEGVYDKQWEAEGRYLQKVGYRYKLVKDNIANYLFLNLNDSLDRIDDYIGKIGPSIDSTKKTFVFTHHDLWAQKIASKEDPKTWTSKLFNGNKLITKLEDFDVFVNGDWNLTYAENDRVFNGENHKAISVGSRMKGDPLNYTVIQLTDTSMLFTPKSITINAAHEWYNNENE